MPVAFLRCGIVVTHHCRSRPIRVRQKLIGQKLEWRVVARPRDLSSYHESPHDHAELGLVLDLINTTFLRKASLGCMY